MGEKCIKYEVAIYSMIYFKLGYNYYFFFYLIVNQLTAQG